MNGWECPKCGYCWSSAVPGCENCNRPENEKYTTSTTIQIEEGNRITSPMKYSAVRCPECFHFLREVSEDFVSPVHIGGKPIVVPNVQTFNCCNCDFSIMNGLESARIDRFIEKVLSDDQATKV